MRRWSVRWLRLPDCFNALTVTFPNAQCKYGPLHSEQRGRNHSQLSGLRTEHGKDGMLLEPRTSLLLFGCAEFDVLRPRNGMIWCIPSEIRWLSQQVRP